MAGLEIRLLGGFELAREGQTLDQLPLRAARSLFAYLVLNRERPHTRDLLAGTFWPEFDDSRARRRLSQAMWQIRTTIGEDGERYLVGGPDTVRFNPDAAFRLDVDEFERALDGDDIARAVEIYRGDLLAGFYDDWLFIDQDRLRSRFLGALERLTDTEFARGDLEGALVHARRLAAENEFDEEAHRRVMRIAVLLGRHSEAILQFEECRRILSVELGSRPSSDTIALYEATLADRDSGGRALPPSEDTPLFEDAARAPFVGREAERAQFAQRLDDTLDGKGGVVLIEGEAGVGKTRLLAEVAADARWRGMDVLWGRSTPSGGRPFASLAEALDGIVGLRARQVAGRLDPAWRSVLAPLAPVLAGDAPASPAPVRRADEQARMREAITTAFRSVAAFAPTLVVLEDAHWADDDTIQALIQLVGQIEGDRLLFAVSYRHGEARERSDVWGLLRSLDRMPHCSRVSLAPYSPAQTEELIRRSLGMAEVSGEFSDRLHRETGGIPLFIVETLRALYERNDLASAQLDTEEAPPSSDRLPVTPAVHSLIRHRLDALEPASRGTIELVSAHDGDLSLAEIEAASDLGPGEALAAVDDLIKRRFLSSIEGSYAAGHELMRRVVYDGLALSQRLDIHRRVALAIEQHRPDDVEVLAHHFITARMPERAATYLERAAARAISVHAYDTAVLHLERASACLDEISAPAEQRFTVAALHEEVLDVLGRRDDQRHTIQQMERFATGPQRTIALTRKAWWLAHQDEFEQAVDTAREGLRLAEQEGDPGRTVAALTALGMIACFGGKATEGVEYLEKAADFRGVDRSQEADARNALGQNLIDLQRFGEAESQLLAALAIYGDLDDARGQADVLGMLATVRMERGEPESAEMDYQRAIEVSRRIGYRHGEAVNQMNLGILLVITNRLGEALRMFDTAAETYGLMGNARGRALVQSNAAWLWHALVGDDDQADHLVHSALEVYDRIGDKRGRAHCVALLGSTAGRRGNPVEAVKWFDEAISLTREAGDAWLNAQALRDFAAFELASGRHLDGLAHALEAEALCKEHGMNALVVVVRALVARLYLKSGDVDRAFEYARRALREIRPGIELAHMVPYAMGEVLEAKGQHAEAMRNFLHSHDLLMNTLRGLPPTTLKMSLANVPAHRIVHEKWRSQQPEVTEVRLPAAAAPFGRPLTDDDHLTVKWTVHDPSDNDLPDRVIKRQARLLRLVMEATVQSALPTVDHLAAALGASSATVRRDLAVLRSAGHSVATRGNR